MKKFLSVIIVGTLLMSGCNNPRIENISNTRNQLSESNSMPTDEHLNADTSSTTSKLPELLNTDSDNSQISEPTIEKEENDLIITITVNERKFSATLYNNETAKAFKEHLPLTLDMNELNGNEKYYYLSDSLPRNSSRPSMINAGDIMLYGSDCLVIFYDSFPTSYSYTPIGKIDDPDGLAESLGGGNVQVAFN